MNKPLSSPCRGAQDGNQGHEAGALRRSLRPMFLNALDGGCLFESAGVYPSRPSTGGKAVALGFALALAACVPGMSQSLWKEETSRSMVADKRAHAVGDVVTILIQESNTASKNNNTTTEKKTSMDAAVAAFLFSPAASGLLTKSGQLPAIKYNYDHQFNGGGSINNSENFTARIAVSVVDVLPNGNLVLEGTKKTAVSGETQDAVLRGIVRPEDVTANNTVFSYNVADVTIKYVSKGTVTDAQRKGWLTKIFEKITPF